MSINLSRLLSSPLLLPCALPLSIGKLLRFFLGKSNPVWHGTYIFLPRVLMKIKISNPKVSPSAKKGKLKEGEIAGFYFCGILNYGFCNKLLRCKWTSDQLNTFSSLWLITQQTSQKSSQRFICIDVASYKILFGSRGYFLSPLDFDFSSNFSKCFCLKADNNRVNLTLFSFPLMN